MYTLEQYLKGNKVSAECVSNAKLVVAFINDVIAKVPSVRITSTVRTPAHNKQVNGVENSKHLTTRCLAVDFGMIQDKGTRDKIQSVAVSHGFGFLVHDVGSGNHIHCEWKGVKKK
jgi:uncharacterized protein YcbK (DUF882 family)